jgi:Ca-activated chloride channel family protein
MKAFLQILLFAVMFAVIGASAMIFSIEGGFRHLVFEQPWWALFALVPLLAVLIRCLARPRPATMRFSRKRSLDRVGRGFVSYLVHVPDGMRLAAAFLLAATLARPQSSHASDRIEHEGIDIAVALDLSESMDSSDLYPTRLDAAKEVIEDFIKRRPHDRIALVAFGAHASTVAPLTMDHKVLISLVRRMRLGVMDGKRTAIGAGIGVSLNRLEESEAESRVIVLLTDGVHNADGIDPDSVAQRAADRGVQIYTVLVGKHAGRGGQSIDPAQLERLASATGGYAYTAADDEALTTSFQDLLDKLEKSTIEGEQVRAELFFWLLWPAFLLLLLDVLLRNTRLRRFP